MALSLEMQRKLIGEPFNLGMIMKKLFNSIFVVIAAMVTFAGCAKEEIAAPETKTVHFFAESIQTKTAFGTPDGTTYPTLWTENDEKVKLLLNLNEEKVSDITVSDDFKTATFSAEFALTGENPSVAPFTFYALTPSSAYLGKNAERFSVTIPNAQTPLENSVDEAAQILYAVSESYEELPSEVAFHFNHFTAYGKLSFKNLNLDGATVESIALTSDVNIAGRWNYMIADGSFAENSGSSSITLTTDKTENIWFACAPADLSNTTLKITINTDKGQLVKEVKLGADRKFEAGKIAKFAVDMNGVTFGKSVIYEKVMTATELTPDSKIIIVAAESEFALSTTQNSNNRGQASIKKSDDGLTITNPGDDVQVLTVEAVELGSTVAFNTGAGYLYAASSDKNYLRTQENVDGNATWAVTITEGIASIVAQGTYTRNTVRYNEGNSMFSCYLPENTMKDVAIYKLQGSGTVLENYLSVSTTEINVEADATSASFTVSSDLQWTARAASAGCSVRTEGNTVNLSFGANTTSSERTYTVTVSADGVESKTVTITQAKKILKTKLTVAEFKALPDANDLYELTGVITGIYQEYNAQYKNISFYLKDDTGEITIFRMSCEGIDHTKVVAGNTITVKGAKTTYKEAAQMAAGCVCLEIIEANSGNDDGGNDDGGNDDGGNVGGGNDGDVIFLETFAECGGTMGWTGSVANGVFKTDNEGWTVNKAYGADGAAKFGTSSVLGYAETPALNMTGNATLTFKAGAWKGDQTTLKISMTGGDLSQETVTMVNEAWTEYTIQISNATTGAKIKFEGMQASKGRFFIDDIKIVK